MKIRVKIFIRGVVQGVGFRPFIFRLAYDLGLTGYVRNSPAGVSVEAEGEKNIIDGFILKINSEKPSLASIHGMEYSFHDFYGFSDFKVIESSAEGEPRALMLPDIALCEDCLRELFDPLNRRYLYPFINCTNCGPRFSIIEKLPYDRCNTSMNNFKMCSKCNEEYENPLDRRFHAQPVACPDCGPRVFLLDAAGKLIADKNDAVLKAAELINSGKIIALKGLGGFQLIADAANNRVVKLLRERKNRERKPFAVMCRDISSVLEICEADASEKSLLTSPESPIMLLKKKNGGFVSGLTAPGNPCLGVMLPYTPLHYLLMSSLDIPVIATSGNLSEEPMCIEDGDAMVRLGGIADYFLVHNRGIVRPVDDSVARIVNGRIMLLRRARGYAPLPFPSDENGNSLIALGGQLKNSISVKKGKNIFISQHIGDLENTETEDCLKRTINDLAGIYNINPDAVVHDLHPGYSSTRIAGEMKYPAIAVQHHHSHAAACYTENLIVGKCMAVCWDGTGYGTDQTIWGSEFFIYDGDEFIRTAHIRQFTIPGNDMAVKDIRRCAAGVFHKLYGEGALRKMMRLDAFAGSSDLEIIIAALEKNINCYSTSSMGRLFDAAAFISGISSYSYFEGESAMAFEFAASEGVKDSYPFDVEKKQTFIINWNPLFEKLIEDAKEKTAPGIISAKFHNALINMIASVAMMVNEKKILLTGGCFQNMYLLNGTINKLRQYGFQPYWHQRIPPNDGGISFGQAVIASHRLNKKEV